MSYCQNNYVSLPFVEIEVRLGTIVTNENNTYFDNNLDKLYFQQINTALMLEGVWQSIEELSTVEYYYSGNSGNSGGKKSESIRLIENKNNNSVSMKENIISNTIQLFNSPFDIRFSVNQEFIITDNSFNKNDTFMRKKARKSFISENFKYDLTVVVEINNNIEKEKYEIEIELLQNNQTMKWSKEYINDFLECKVYDLINIVEKIEKKVINLVP